MHYLIIYLLLVIFELVGRGFCTTFSQDKCDQTKCQLPDCFCSGTVPPINPGAPQKNPQIVHLTFDDPINIINYPLYLEIFNERKNPNGANITGTFFIRHEYNNYNTTHQIWRQGHEIAFSTLTRNRDWRNMNESQWKEEVVDHREIISYFGRIPEEDIVGFRPPVFMGSDVMYEVLSSNGIKYASAIPSVKLCPNLWPYTMDYDSVEECGNGSTPFLVKSFTGFWNSPMVDLIGNNGESCAFLDTCLPAPTNVDETFKLLKRNFEDHYNASRSPFALHTHAAWFLNPETPWIKEGYLSFVDHVLSLGDAFIVSIKKGLEWVRDPHDLGDISDFAPWKNPDTVPVDGCRNVFSCMYDEEHTPPGIGERMFSSCTLCPPNYPWVGNPRGE